MNVELSPLQTWSALAIAAAGTYACRALGVMASGKINQDSEFFRWLSAVTYALVAALVVRMVLMPARVVFQDAPSSFCMCPPFRCQAYCARSGSRGSKGRQIHELSRFLLPSETRQDRAGSSPAAGISMWMHPNSKIALP